MISLDFNKKDKEFEVGEVIIIAKKECSNITEVIGCNMVEFIGVVIHSNIESIEVTLLIVVVEYCNIESIIGVVENL